MAAPTETIAPGRAAIEQAAAWHVELAEEDCGEARKAAFEAWLAADPAHRIAFERMQAIANRAARQDDVTRSALETALIRRPRGVSALVLAFAACAVLLSGIAVNSPTVRSRLADERTDIGELRSASLASGDRITLDTDSAADVDDDGRSVSLWQGGIMVDVRPHLARSLTVWTPHGTARALGTRFSVRTDSRASVVTVIESRVEACSAQGVRHCVALAPGESVRLDAEGVHPLDDVDPTAASSWADGLLIADDTPLSVVLGELNRYRLGTIRFTASDIAGLSVTGTVPLTDADRALASISVALPVIVEEQGGLLTVRRR